LRIPFLNNRRNAASPPSFTTDAPSKARALLSFVLFYNRRAAARPPLVKILSKIAKNHEKNGYQYLLKHSKNKADEQILYCIIFQAMNRCSSSFRNPSVSDVRGSCSGLQVWSRASGVRLASIVVPAIGRVGQGEARPAAGHEVQRE
jgi:hypothetical protein